MLAAVLMGLGAMEELRCYPCPECGSPEVAPTMKTRESTYCRCPLCGHIWHEDRTDARPEPPLKRRKQDHG